MSQTDNLYKSNYYFFKKELEREITSPNKRKESQKSEIANLLNTNFHKKSFKKNEFRIEDICEKEKISKFHFFSKSPKYENEKIRFNSPSNIFLNSSNVSYLISDKYSSDVILKMQKKLPHFIEDDRRNNLNKNSIQHRNKLNGIKSKIDKLFD